jgi:hypothetical protein
MSADAMFFMCTTWIVIALATFNCLWRLEKR